MATECLTGKLAHARWFGVALAGMLWTAGCSTPQVSDRSVTPRVPALQATRPVTSHKPPTAPDSARPIQQVQHTEELPPARVVSSKELPSPKELPSDRYPIDLTTSLQLAGANNLQIALASERIRQFQARLEGAEAQWLPSLNLAELPQFEPFVDYFLLRLRRKSLVCLARSSP